MRVRRNPRVKRKIARQWMKSMKKNGHTNCNLVALDRVFRAIFVGNQFLVGSIELGNSGKTQAANINGVRLVLKILNDD